MVCRSVDIMKLLQRDGSSASVGTGLPRSTDGRTPSVDKKELSVWKLPDQVTKQEFRHWLDTIDTNLDAAQHFHYPEIVLDKVKRFESEINSASWMTIVASADEDIPENKKIDAMIASGRERGSEGFSGGADSWHTRKSIAADWGFVKKSRFLYTFLLSKLNTELHGKTIGIEGWNGFELYRQVVQAIDKIPENAKFLMGADIPNLVHKYGDNCTDSVSCSRSGRPSARR